MIPRDGKVIGNIRDYFPKMGNKGPRKKSPILTPTMTYPKDAHLYDMIYYPAMPLEKFNEVNIHGPCRELNNLMETICKMSAYQLYQVPAVKQHFGDEFVHGFSAKADSKSNAVHFLNLDDTMAAARFTKEMAYIVEQVIKNLLNRYDLYLYYGGNFIEIFDRSHFNLVRKRVESDERLFWDK